MTAPATRLRVDARRTTLTTEPASSVSLELGYQSVAETFFRHDPPTPSELELAIEAIEDALMSARAQKPDKGTLVTSDDIMRLIPGLRPDGATTTLEEVEARFQQLASVSLGLPASRLDMPLGRVSAAALLILRECMHHIGFEGLVLEQLECPSDASPRRPS